MVDNDTTVEEQKRATFLRDAQCKALQLFEEIEQRLIRPGISEKTLSDEIHELGAKRYGVRTHWHKRVIRSGPNTLLPYAENPPDRIIQPDDILFVDLGPVFEAWEADFGRTFVLGDDPIKKRLRDALQPVWAKVKSLYMEKPDMTGEKLYRIACDVAIEEGWGFGGQIAGHLISLYITKGSTGQMSSRDANGRRRHWILEIHLVD
ncbi:Creatinase/aminopeptidase [Setomelanomma holmii]|uniref:Creatinase/aminopeptidase n=1 Tax=Setomelanomma holmii TaxID=210430 RepID=A0A9P4H4Z6_9PLEO|nr:Creatinase/aminopeptidase [Setomelanomma holmii]